MEQAHQLLDHTASLLLATVAPDGQPQASYAPFVRTEDATLYVFISELAPHTQNLRHQARASCLVIEDESRCDNIFARRRLQLECSARFISPNDAIREHHLDALGERHGDTVATLRALPDFHLVALVPFAGTLITDFAAATVLDAASNPDLIPDQTSALS